MAAWFIDDFSRTKILITDTVRNYYIPKFAIEMAVVEPFLYITWSNRQTGTGGDERGLPPINYLDVVDGYSGYVDNPTSATDLMAQINAMVDSAWTSISPVGGDILNAKSQLLGHDGVSDTILSGGANETILSRDDAAATGLAWIAKSGIYSDESAQDAVGNILDTADFTYNDGVPSIAMKDSFSYIIAYTGTVASTNTTGEEALASMLIPGGTLATGDLIVVEVVGRKTSGSAANTFRTRIHTASGTGGTEIANYATTAQQSYVMGPKVLVTGAATQIGWPAFSNATYSVGSANTTTPTLAIANDIYINITNQKITGTDGFELRAAVVTIQKKR